LEQKKKKKKHKLDVKTTRVQKMKKYIIFIFGKILSKIKIPNLVLAHAQLCT